MTIDHLSSQENQDANRPGLEDARRFVDSVYSWTERESAAAGAPPELSAVLCRSVLQASFPVFLQHPHGNPVAAPSMLTHIWADHAAVFGLNPVQPPPLEPRSSAISLAPDAVEYFNVFTAAVNERLARAKSGDNGRSLLRRIITSLAISYDEAGRMFQVSGETIRRWETGITAIPVRRLAEITTAADALDLLLSLFLPERLPIVIRRPADLFDGEPALEWILRGRIRDVADHYDRVLSYQA